MTRHYNGYLSQSDLTVSQMSMLASITFFERVRPSDLASEMHLDNSTITRTLRTLRQRGFIEYLPGVDDRSRLITLTDAGQTAYTRARRHWRRDETTLAEQMGTDSVDELHALLNSFTERLEESLQH